MGDEKLIIISVTVSGVNDHIRTFEFKLRGGVWNRHTGRVVCVRLPKATFTSDPVPRGTQWTVRFYRATLCQRLYAMTLCLSVSVYVCVSRCSTKMPQRRNALIVSGNSSVSLVF